jgi:hypothetical protein
LLYETTTDQVNASRFVELMQTGSLRSLDIIVAAEGGGFP